MKEETVTVTRHDLAVVLERWAKTAAEEKWPESFDDERHDRAAEYLFILLRSK